MIELWDERNRRLAEPANQFTKKLLGLSDFDYTISVPNTKHTVPVSGKSNIIFNQLHELGITKFSLKGIWPDWKKQKPNSFGMKPKPKTEGKYVLVFENEDDALLFKLTFGGTE